MNLKISSDMKIDLRLINNLIRKKAEVFLEKPYGNTIYLRFYKKGLPSLSLINEINTNTNGGKQTEAWLSGFSAAFIAVDKSTFK